MEMEEPVSLSEEDLCLDRASPALSGPSIDYGPEVLVMTVEIGDGRQDTLTVREHDDPSSLAAEFADKHGLDMTMQKTLERLIRQHRNLADMRATSMSPDMADWKEWLRPNSATDPYIFQDVFLKRANASQTGSTSGRSLEKRGQPAINRFFELGKNKRSSMMSSVASNLTRCASESGFNYGEWLYVKGKKLKETKRREAEAKLKETLKKEQKEWFSPKINDIPVLDDMPDVKIEDRLAKKGLDKKAHIEKMKNELNRKELKECSFKPKLSQTSIEMNLKKVVEVPRYEKLFEEAKKQQERKKAKVDQKDREFNYSPCIELTCSKTVSDSNGDVVERLLSSKRKFDEKMSRLRLEGEGRGSFDSEAGFRFTPSTGRASSARNSIGKSIFEHLYSMKDNKKQLVERLAEKHQQEVSETSVHINEHSSSIFNSFRKKQYERLFRALDVDNDGTLTSADIAQACLDSDVMNVLKPLFVEIEVSGLQLKIDQFILKVDALLAPLTVQDRAIVLKRESKMELEESEFKPTISPISVAYAIRRRGNKPASLYERRVLEKKEAEERNRIEAKINLKKDMKKCTFKPATTPYLTRKQQRLAN